ncbi:MAG TPA: hypothetical protein VLR94_12115 [Acidobacteriota bacterium]|nr:hypothetical protein [Acidobacteriota bacterium]
MKLIWKLAGVGVLVSLLLVTCALTTRILCSPQVYFLKLIWRALISA